MAVLMAALFGFTPTSAHVAPADDDPPGSIVAYPPKAPALRNSAGSNMPMADTVPELIHYRFDGTGTSVPNLASSPPTGTATATIMGGVSQTGPDLNLSGNGFSLVGTGDSSVTDYLDTGWATNLGTGSWTISFVSSNIGPSSTLYYVFGDLSAGGFRCFTNGVAGPTNWILRGTLNDVLVPGGAVEATRRTTFVYDQPAGEIRAYLDGALVNTVAQPLLSVVGTGPFKFMGYSSNVGSPAGGLLDDFRVYNRALSAQEVMDLDTALGELTITPTDLSFGAQPVGSESPPASVILANAGGAPLYVTALETPTAPFELSGNDCGDVPFALPPGAECTLDFRFAPTETGTFEQTLAVTSDSLGGGSILLSGSGVQGNLSIHPTAIDFGEVVLGDSSDESIVTLSNTGTLSLDVIELTAAAAAFSRTGGSCPKSLPFTLANGASCTLGYTFSPDATGLLQQTLTVTADAPGSGSVELSGTGVQGNLTIDPAAVDFGTLVVGDVSALATVTLSNDGDGDLDVVSLSPAAEPFFRTSEGSCANDLPIYLPVGASCTLTYAYAPIAAGIQEQTLVLLSNGTGDTELALRGEASPAENEIFFDGFEPID